jgi:predicted nuclease of predicted toxin-antitoxin system
VKLLFDQNLSHHLVKEFEKEFPGSTHVLQVGLERATDGPVWEYAKENGFVIVSKDADFHQRSFLYGHPPKVVWIRRGNCSTSAIESIIRAHRDDLVKFAESEHGSFLALL